MMASAKGPPLRTCRQQGVWAGMMDMYCTACSSFHIRWKGALQSLSELFHWVLESLLIHSSLPPSRYCYPKYMLTESI
jgi:hypothetical protein